MCGGNFLGFKLNMQLSRENRGSKKVLTMKIEVGKLKENLLEKISENKKKFLEQTKLNEIF
jgi:regulator of replication initiation timing